MFWTQEMQATNGREERLAVRSVLLAYAHILSQCWSKLAGRPASQAHWGCLSQGPEQLNLLKLWRLLGILVTYKQEQGPGIVVVYRKTPYG